MIDHPLGALLVAVFGIGAVVCTAITWWPIKKSGSSAGSAPAPPWPVEEPDLSLSGPAGGGSCGPLASGGGEPERVPSGSDVRPLDDGWPHPRRFFDGDAA